MSEQLVSVLGFDWLLAFLAPRIHSGTVFLGLRLLLSLLVHPQLLHKFREGSANGGWLADADSVVRNRAAVSVPSALSCRSSSASLSPEAAAPLVLMWTSTRSCPTAEASPPLNIYWPVTQPVPTATSPSSLSSSGSP